MEASEGRDVALQQGGEDAEPVDGGEDGLGGAGDAGVAQARGVAVAGGGGGGFAGGSALRLRGTPHPPTPPPHSAAAFSASLCALAVILTLTSSGTQSSMGSGLTTMSVMASWSETVPRTATTTAWRFGRGRPKFFFVWFFYCIFSGFFLSFFYFIQG